MIFILILYNKPGDNDRAYGDEVFSSHSLQLSLFLFLYQASYGLFYL